MTLNESVNAPVPLVERPVSDNTIGVRRRSGKSAGADDGMLGLGLLAGPANVIMQLARPGVGYGVLESRVESGRVDRHPIKRARTTFTYLAVSTNGSDAQKAAFRRAVNGAHAQVFSTDESPVEYHAFDRDLQLWVGACLYKGVVDVHRLFVGEMDDETADRLYLQGRALATMLQVPETMWPADRAAFDRYWQAALDDVHIDDTVRDYLYPIAASRLRGVTLPAPLQRRSEELALLITTGFLPQRFRDEMRLPWDARRQRRFDRLMAVLRTVNTVSPTVVRQFPFNVLLKDVDRRMRAGRPLV
ncbi:FadD27 [Mycolicibacterium aurum]|uniref:FadD27 n=1 Tax=Mycolicibacterium aurum TaxID=1791 RepID=A0A3S4SE90_MYCAU|nr:oxygenase MpaB family protein [Mycolicibacterium aurum]VEG51264.1 FadD27 [Mycolicibacterium aurum]